METSRTAPAEVIAYGKPAPAPDTLTRVLAWGLLVYVLCHAVLYVRVFGPGIASAKRNGRLFEEFAAAPRVLTTLVMETTVAVLLTVWSFNRLIRRRSAARMLMLTAALWMVAIAFPTIASLASPAASETRQDVMLDAAGNWPFLFSLPLIAIACACAKPVRRLQLLGFSLLTMGVCMLAVSARELFPLAIPFPPLKDLAVMVWSIVGDNDPPRWVEVCEQRIAHGLAFLGLLLVWAGISAIFRMRSSRPLLIAAAAALALFPSVTLAFWAWFSVRDMHMSSNPSLASIAALLSNTHNSVDILIVCICVAAGSRTHIDAHPVHLPPSPPDSSAVLTSGPPAR